MISKLFALTESYPELKANTNFLSLQEDLKNVERIVTAGTRPYDIAIRIKVSGYPVENIIPCLTVEEAVKKLYETNVKKYVITNYTSVQPTRHELIKFKEKSEEN